MCTLFSLIFSAEVPQGSTDNAVALLSRFLDSSSVEQFSVVQMCFKHGPIARDSLSEQHVNVTTHRAASIHGAPSASARKQMLWKQPKSNKQGKITSVMS